MSFYILQAALEDAQSGRTTLTIAHRLLGKSLKKSSFVPYLMAKCFFLHSHWCEATKNRSPKTTVALGATI